jgi:hypothetical protein
LWLSSASAGLDMLNILWLSSTSASFEHMTE